MNNKIIVGTRGSKLAIIQTEFVVNLLREKSDYEFVIKEIKTTGDIKIDKRFTDLGGIGVFVKEIEDSLIRKEIDIAVHSMKDVPVDIPEELIISAILKREYCGDALISEENKKLKDLKHRAVIGTSSVRRKFQLLNYRKDFQIKELRGNLDTRIRKLTERQYDAIIVSEAGLRRLNMFHLATEIISFDIMLPAVGQGVIGIETRKDEKGIIKILKEINDKDTELSIITERTFLKEMGGGCHIPIGAYAYIKNDKLVIEAEVFDDKGNRTRRKISGDKKDAEKIGIELAKEFK